MATFALDDDLLRVISNKHACRSAEEVDPFDDGAQNVGGRDAKRDCVILLAAVAQNKLMKVDLYRMAGHREYPLFPVVLHLLARLCLHPGRGLLADGIICFEIGNVAVQA